MLKIDLITGFLGSGKTSFIKKYAKYLIEQGERVCILENDYGAINIDMVLLKDLPGPNCELEMVVGGDGAEAHKRRFRTKLISIRMLGFTRVIVEPSGIYDVDEFFDTLYESPLDEWYEAGSVITIMDPVTATAMSEESRYLLMSEAARAGKVLISKLDETSNIITVTRDAVNYLNASMEHFECKRRFSGQKDILAKPWEELTDEDFESIKNAGFINASHVKLSPEDDHYQSLFYLYYRTSEAELREKISKLFEDRKAGNIFRIKGFITDTGTGASADRPDESGTDARNKDITSGDPLSLEVNATVENIEIKLVTGETQDVLIVIGEQLNKERISDYFPGAVTV
ncbi:MAG: GTPase (G3E family) [Oribacterium sp.]|nr:GTPase (G3E family) [Oribacterium sp.]